MKPAPWRFAVLAFALLFVSTSCGRGGPAPLPLAGFKVEFGEQNIPTQMAADKTVSADISVKNASERTWQSKPDQKGRYAVNLSYHWLDRKGQVVVFDGLRTPLPQDLKPGESVKINASIRAPQHPGQYTLEVTLVQEAAAWFPEKDGGQLTVPVNVVEAAAPDNTRDSLPEKENAEALGVKKTASSRPAPSVDKPEQGGEQRSKPWTVQAGSYSRQNDAETRAKQLSDKGYDAYVVAASVKGRRRYQVRIGHLASRAEAVKLQDTLKVKEHLEQAFVASSR
ncbi:MAG: SPOR domain-containing protein [Alphaproteobacteria bacterium]